jgi:hypothetical protein
MNKLTMATDDGDDSVHTLDDDYYITFTQHTHFTQLKAKKKKKS